MVELFRQGGPTMYPLLLCSIVCIAVIVERAYAFWTSRANIPLLIWRLREYLPQGRLEDAKMACRQESGPVAAVALAGLENWGKPKEQIESAMARAALLETAHLERYLPALATVGAVAPLLGLFGTVLGIMDAFRAVAERASAGPSVVAGGVAEALITTAFGLGIGVVALVGYNYFVSAARRISTDMDAVASEVLDLLSSMPLPEEKEEAKPAEESGREETSEEAREGEVPPEGAPPGIEID